MKILIIGDFHGKFPEKLKKIAKRKDIDLVVSVGDHTGITEWKPIMVARLKAARKGEKIPTPEEIIGKKRYDILSTLKGGVSMMTFLIEDVIPYSFFLHKTNRSYKFSPTPQMPFWISQSCFFIFLKKKF